MSEDTRELHELAFARALLNKDSEAGQMELVNRFSRGLTCMLIKRTGNPDLSQDLVQETFRLVIQKLRNGEVKEPAKIIGYLRQVAINLLIANHRKNKHWVQGEENMSEPEDAAPSGESRLEQNQRVQLVRKVIAEMTKPRDREALIRFYVAEEDRTQICADMKLDTLQLTKILHRARGRFKQIWQSKKGMDRVGG